MESLFRLIPPTLVRGGSMGTDIFNISGVLLFSILEQLAIAWGENCRPEDIRLDMSKINTLIGVNELITRDVAVGAALLTQCPNFIRVYRQVMLRDIKEQIEHGSPHEGGSN